MCTKRYQRWVNAGKPGFVPKEQLLSSLCSVVDCGRTAKGRGLCNRHYENLRRYGHAIPVRDRPVQDRLEQVGWDVTADECWEWRGRRNEHGYGLISAPRLGLDQARVHRLMYELHVAPLGDKKACHRCDNPPCVNPDHIFPGTQADNVADMIAKGRHWTQTRTECGNGHDLTAPGVQKTITRNGETGKICVACARGRKRRYAAKQRRAVRDAA